MTLARAIIASVTLVFLTACQSDAGDNAPGNLAGIEGKRWIAEAIAGEDVIAGSRVTLQIKGDRVSGKAGCNSYGGSANIDGAGIKFGALFSTKMACTAPGVMVQEQRFLNVLQRSVYGRIDGNDKLTLTTADGKSLIFKADPNSGS